MNQPKLSDFCIRPVQVHANLDYKLYRNKLPCYFDNFLPEFGIHNHTLKTISCDFRLSDPNLEKLMLSIKFT